MFAFDVEVNRPQNVAGQTGHATYEGSSPVFVTTKLDAVERLAGLAALDPSTGKPHNTEASMIYRRLKVYSFSTRIVKPPPNLKYCPRCFAQLVLSQGA